MARLNTTIVLRDDDFQTHVFTPNVDVPKWAVDKITTPGVWAKSEKPSSKPEAPEAPPAPKSPEFPDDGGTPDGGTPDVKDVPIPPKAGAGSSAKAWAEYAKSKGFAVDEDAKAGEIREALAEAGIPTE